ncbi:phosphatidate cytidylyltransferase [Parvularcula lutaonensis]|uniref:Phosphatidate cytidylyltransferase n=1 Tax=Parvularcula lutaonensis TaxID=491923 RepID=A0ABV7ME24_9PROT|nr:phosphatidate cytidylyltransferase [Parvularcula lutaonensis]GGY54411.1 phosphatidate cytidylyltransferase [Parvularcula lutaonensis]
MTSEADPKPGEPGLLPRILTAAFLIPLALGSVLAGGRLYAALIAAMTIFLLFEWTRMVDGAELRRGFYVLSATTALAAYLAAGGLAGWALLAALAGGAVATALEWPKPNPQSWPAVGAGYIIVPCVAALWLRRDAPEGEFLTLLLFIAVWAADSGAYFVGKALGGPKLVPRISPRKTWAGAIGAVLFAGVAAGALALIVKPEETGGSWLLGMVIGVAAVLGDITESYFKRRYGMKDSGGAFPGHGGVLDRLDGFLFAVLALATIVLLLQGVS